MEISVYNQEGIESSERVHLEDAVFNQVPHEHAMYQAVHAQMAHMRQGTHASKNRALVRGGGKKPYRQKGTGRARAGTTRSPLWRGGGTIFGPMPHRYSYQLPKKVKSLARISALSYASRNGNIRVLESFEVDSPKTKQVAGLLGAMELSGRKVLFVTHETTRNFLLSCRNIPNVIVREYKDISTYDILNCDYLLIHKNAIEELNKLGNYEGSDTSN